VIRQKYTKYADTDARGINMCFFLYVLCAYTTTTTSKGGFSFAVMKQGRGVSSSCTNRSLFPPPWGGGDDEKDKSNKRTRCYTRSPAEVVECDIEWLSGV
jgi:hypothetical protein